VDVDEDARANPIADCPRVRIHHPPEPPRDPCRGPKRPPSVAEFRQWEEKKMLKKYVQSLNVYENKHTQDTMPEKNQRFMSYDSDIFV
jgi:hypothetical protein